LKRKKEIIELKALLYDDGAKNARCKDEKFSKKNLF
jgi:hypothetical protein